MNRCPKPSRPLTAHVLLVTTCATVNACSRATNTYMRAQAGDGNSLLYSRAIRQKLMTHDFRSKQDMEVGVDTERAFMIVEIAGDNFTFRPSRVRADNGFGTVARQ